MSDEKTSKDCKPCPQLDWCGAKGTTHCEHLHFAPGGKCPKATLGLDRDFLERTTQEARIKNQRSETTQTVTQDTLQVRVLRVLSAINEFAAQDKDGRNIGIIQGMVLGLSREIESWSAPTGGQKDG